MRLLVFGSRTWTDAETIRKHLAAIRPDEVIHGGNGGWNERRRRFEGADYLAGREAEALGIPVRTFHAAWQTHGRAAGPMRNQRMLTEGLPDRALGFRMPGESRGTDDMAARVRRAAIPLEIVEKTP